MCEAFAYLDELYGVCRRNKSGAEAQSLMLRIASRRRGEAAAVKSPSATQRGCVLLQPDPLVWSSDKPKLSSKSCTNYPDKQVRFFKRVSFEGIDKVVRWSAYVML